MARKEGLTCDTAVVVHNMGKFWWILKGLSGLRGAGILDLHPMSGLYGYVFHLPSGKRIGLYIHVQDIKESDRILSTSIMPAWSEAIGRWQEDDDFATWLYDNAAFCINCPTLKGYSRIFEVSANAKG